MTFLAGLYRPKYKSMNTTNRLQNIEKRINNNPRGKLTDYATMVKIQQRERTGAGELITLQEWEGYKTLILAGVGENDRFKAQDEAQKYLKQLENKIRAGNGFMEINFVNSIPLVLQEKYGIAINI